MRLIPRDSSRQALRLCKDGACHSRTTAIPKGTASTMTDLPRSQAKRFGIVIPAYNAHATLAAAIDSVLAQADQGVDVVVVDGGSSDGSQALLAGYGNRIRWISEPDKGQTDAINKGMRLVEGQIIKFLNADDRLLPGALKQVWRHFVDHPLDDFVYGDIDFIDTDGNRVGGHKEPRFSSFIVTYGHNLFADPACFWRRGVLEKVGLFDERCEYSMDFEFWLRCIDAGVRFGRIPAPLAQFRVTGRNKSVKDHQAMRQEHWDLVIERRGWLSILPRRFSYAALKVLMLAARLYKKCLVLLDRGPEAPGQFNRIMRSVDSGA